MIQPEDIPLYDDPAPINAPAARGAIALADTDEPYHLAKDRVMAQFEQDYLSRLVERAGGNMSKAARVAGVDRTTLYRLMDKHKVPRGEREGDGE
jgi:transcriptional regulator of acetoin/glycerol metabolism